MIQRLLLILVSLWPTAISTLSAQVGFSLPFLNNVDSGTTVTVPVRVSNFDSIVAAQFVVQWDPEVLSFVKVILYNLPGMDYLDFGLTEAPDSGLIRFAWEAPTGSFNSGVTVPDQTAIYRIQFNVVGQVNAGTPLLITEIPPTDFEVVRVGHPALTIDSCSIENGFVAVGYTVATHEPEKNTLPVTITPNPFSDSFRVVFDLETNEIVHFRLTDAAGRLVEEKKMSLSPGQHGMEIVSDQLQENGIYYLIIRTATRSCISPLVKF
jgi:hypothetical protein